jgi:hypothetical protein
LLLGQQVAHVEHRHAREDHHQEDQPRRGRADRAPTVETVISYFAPERIAGTHTANHTRHYRQHGPLSLAFSFFSPTLTEHSARSWRHSPSRRCCCQGTRRSARTATTPGRRYGLASPCHT